MEIRRAQERGHANFGWLDSHHSFSFGQYYDPNHMGVSALRVINDDRVTPGDGFGTHGHQNMEILSYVLKGTIEHKDSMGHRQKITEGEFQIMSAGTGITHSEYNASDTENLHFLQIWLLPNKQNVTPAYEQNRFSNTPGLTAIVHSDDKNALTAQSDASVWRYQGGKQVQFNAEGNRVYVHVVKGSIQIGDVELTTGDGLNAQTNSIDVLGDADAEALIFDLP